MGELLLSTVFGETLTIKSVLGELILSTVFGGGNSTYVFNKVLQNAAANFCHLLAGSENRLIFILENRNMDTIIFSLYL